MSDVRQRLQTIFQEVFDDPAIVLKDEMTANDVDGWDSLAHIGIILAVEKNFGIRLRAAEVASLDRVGTLVDLVLVKSQAA